MQSTEETPNASHSLNMKTANHISIATAFIILCITSTSILHAQQQDNDSTQLSATLNEVVVKSPESIQSGNRLMYYPSKELRETMATSSQLLAGLQIPDLIVNPSNGDIAISGGGKLLIKINGRKASTTDLLTISAKEVTKVEYIPNPGVRYKDYSGVLEITLRQRKQGYGTLLNILQSPNRGWGDYTVALKYNTGSSEWSADYHSNPMWGMDCYRNNDETIHRHDGSVIQRKEYGMNTPNRMVTHRAALQYSYAIKSSILFNAQARLLRKNDRYASSGKIITCHNSTMSESIEKEIAPFSSWQGDLDLYFHWKINRNNKVYFNIVPTVVRSTSRRIYETTDLSISSKIDTRAVMLLGESVWERNIVDGIMTAGVRGETHRERAIYRHDESIIRNNNFEGHTFVEWSHNFGNFRYIAGVDVSIFHLTSPMSRDFANISPRLFSRYTPLPWMGISVSFDGTTVNPSAVQLSPVEQRIDRFQYSEGSPFLKPFHRYNSKLELDFNVNNTTAKLTVADCYSSNPIMSAKSFVANKIMQTYHNSGFHNDLIIKGQLRTPLGIQQLTLSLEGGWHKMVSKGISYRHTYSQGFVNVQLMFINGPWWFMAKYNNAYNLLWGEMISSVNNNLLNIGIGYRYKSATFMAGIVNPIGNVSLKSRDVSAIASYERTYHAASTNCLAWIGITLNIHKGNRRAATQKKLDNNKTYTTIKTIQK